MPIVKTSELTGPALDWAVGFARCLDATEGRPILSRDLMSAAMRNGMASPSTDWTQGGPIIDREGLALRKFVITDKSLQWGAYAYPSIGKPKPDCVYGPTPLIAAMRCYVASKLGDSVEIPSELI